MRKMLNKEIRIELGFVYIKCFEDFVEIMFKEETLLHQITKTLM